ncbi:MAG: IPT/TIG domain-containing protein [Myxococcota bacterium]
MHRFVLVHVMLSALGCQLLLSAPEISTVQPQAARVGDGVTVVGAHMDDARLVLGTTEVAYEVMSDGSLTFEVPPTLAPGPAVLRVETRGGTAEQTLQVWSIATETPCNKRYRQDVNFSTHSRSLQLKRELITGESSLETLDLDAITGLVMHSSSSCVAAWAVLDDASRHLIFDDAPAEDTVSRLQSLADAIGKPLTEES